MGPNTSTRRSRTRAGPLRFACLLLIYSAISWLTAAGSNPARSDDQDPFIARAHDGLSGVLQAWPMRVSPCTVDGIDLLVVSALGPPDARRKIVTWMPCGSSTRPGDASIVQREVGPEVAFVDVARLPDRQGAQLLMMSAEGIRAESLDPASTEPPRSFPIPGGLPLPTRPRQLSRIEIVEDWHSNGRPVALVPAHGGGQLVDLSTGAVRSLPLPIFANYRSFDPFLPRTFWAWVVAQTRWPTLARADDNGDGRLDLFALSRWEIWIYHTGADGLPPEPSRKLNFQPFSEDIERRHESTTITYFARDIDGDTLADLLLSTVGGGLQAGRTNTRIFMNAGDGVSTDSTAAAEYETPGGFSEVNLIDLDGNGQEEVIELSIEFGVLQAVGMLLTGKIDVTLRVHSLAADEADGLALEFEDDLGFSVDIASSRIMGLVPILGDWNGDGVQDLYVAKGEKAIAFRLGAEPGKGPRFGRATGRQSLPLSSGESRVADLDEDGLDDIIIFNYLEPKENLVILHNQGRLPGTAPILRPQSARANSPTAAERAE